MDVTARRSVLSGLAATVALPALPLARDMPPAPGTTGYVLMDMESGRIIDARRPDDGFVPASTVKSITALATLATLPPTQRFFTRVHGRGPLEDGVLEGDLVLVGGGDAALDTADLDRLAKALRAKDVRRVTGRFLVTGIAWPEEPILNALQPHQAGYNPAIGPLCLNFNRVLLRWRTRQGRRSLTTHAHADDRTVPARSVAARALRRGGALHGLEPGREVWALPERDLRRDGERWFPVRRPDLYAADVFRTLCAEEGIVLPEPRRTSETPTDPPLAMHRSDVVFAQTKKMMKYSTNLTAEMLGIAAARRIGGPPETVADAARTTADWLVREEIVSGEPVLENHSGLSSRSRITPRQMGDILRAGHTRFGGAFAGLHTEGKVRGPQDGLPSYTMRTKTGTMHFVRALAGFLEADGRRAVFAIYAMDERERMALDARFTPYDERKPPGSGRWLRRALDHENALLRRWLERRLR